MRGRAAAVVLAALLAVAPGCGDGGGKRRLAGELRAVVLPTSEGGTVTESDIRTAAGVIDLAIGEMGIARREVVPMADGHLRIVLPESVAARIPEVRKRLADPKLRVRVED